MKQTLLSITLLLSLAAIAAAQLESRIRWQQGAPNTDHFIVNGRTVKTLTLDGLTLGVSLGIERLGTARIYYDKFVVYLYAINLSERRVEITPDIVTLESVRPRARELKRETAMHLANTIQTWAAVAGAAGEAAASLQTTQAAATGSVSGPGGSAAYSETTIAPDMAARQRASQQSAILNGSASRAGIDLERVELKANTLLPNGEVGGMLIFDRDKKCQEAVVRVAVDGKIVEFPFAWEAPQKR